MGSLMRSVFFVFAVSTFAACGSKDANVPAIPEAECAHQLTYEGFADGFVRNNCRGCHGAALAGAARHGAPESINFDTLDDVRQHARRMVARASGDAPTMPPAGGPSDEERALFHEWVMCGMASEEP